MAAVEAVMLNLLIMFSVAAITRFLAEQFPKVTYPIVLLLAGLGVSVSGVEIGLPLTHDVILLVILPTILFFGALRLDFGKFRQHLGMILPLVVVGLPGAVMLLGLVGWRVFEFSLIIALIFASMIYPLDPVAIISIFNEMDAPERLIATVEGESLLDDGVAIVVFSTVLHLYQQGYRMDTSLMRFLTPTNVVSVLGDILWVSVGGLLVGGLASTVLAIVRSRIDDHMNEFLLTVIAAYGSFLVANHFLNVSVILGPVLYRHSVTKRHVPEMS